MGKLKYYFLSTRPQFFPGIIAPVALGAAVAWHVYARFDLVMFLLTLLSASLYHAGMNVINDYFDYLYGSDNINTKALPPFTGGSRFIQNGIITPWNTLSFGAILLFSGSVLGAYLAIKTNPLILLIGAVGLFSGFSYSARPFRFSAAGLGEIMVGINFGLLAVTGSYIVQTSVFGMEALFASLPLSFLIAAILFINEFPDFEADRDSGKRTLVVRIGPSKARLLILVIVPAAYMGIGGGVLLGYMPAASLISLLPIIFAYRAVTGLIKNYAGGAALLPSIRSIIMAHFLTGLLLVISYLV